MTQTRMYRSLALVLALTALLTSTILMTGCTHAPPTLSPAGVADFNATRVIKGLDAFMDVAIVAEAQTPPLVSTATTRRIVDYHQVAVRLVANHVAAPGWQAELLVGLDDVVGTLSPAEQQTLSAYVALVKTLLTEVQ